MTPASRRQVFIWVQAAFLVVVASALLDSGIRFWIGRSSDDYYEPVTTKTREWRRASEQEGRAEISIEVTAPRRVRIHDEHRISVDVLIRGLPRGAVANVTITPTAPGLKIHPSSMAKSTAGFTGGHFIISSATPGHKLLSVTVAAKAPIYVPTTDTSSLDIEAYEERDALARYLSVAQTLGLPALVALLATEFIRRRTSNRG